MVTFTAMGTGIFTAGDDWDLTLTLQDTSGAIDLTGGTVKGTLTPDDPNNTSLTNNSLTLTTPASGIATWSITKAQSDALLGAEATPDYQKIHYFRGDILVVKADTKEIHCGPFLLQVRRKITA